MTIIEEYEYDFNDLMANCWSGAVDTLENIYNENLEDELMDLLEENFSVGGTPTMTEINDFLWFEDEYIYDELGIDPYGEDDEEEEDEEEEDEEEMN